MLQLELLSQRSVAWKGQIGKRAFASLAANGDSFAQLWLFISYVIIFRIIYITIIS